MHIAKFLGISKQMALINLNVEYIFLLLFISAFKTPPKYERIIIPIDLHIV